MYLIDNYIKKFKDMESLREKSGLGPTFGFGKKYKIDDTFETK